MKQIFMLLLIASLLTSCASVPRKRFLYGAGIGAAAGSIGGAALSPNSPSRSLNALVFGLTGAVVGGLIGLFSHDDAELPKVKDSLEARDKVEAKQYAVPADQNLPGFVKERLQPVVVEEFVESASVGEDGSLAEPHRVWRIKHQAELVPKPVSEVKSAP